MYWFVALGIAKISSRQINNQKATKVLVKKYGAKVKNARQECDPVLSLSTSTLVPRPTVSKIMLVVSVILETTRPGNEATLALM